MSIAVHSINAQQFYRSPKFGYSLTIPSGWRVKDQIVMPNTDVKIVDDRGNSFVVSITPLPSEFRNTSATKLLSKASNQDLIDLWASTYSYSYIMKRGTTIVSGKEFYFAHLNCPFQDGLRLIHKMYMYNWKGRSVSIDCASISSMEDETSVYFDVMIQTFKLE